MPFTRYTESQFRQLLDLLDLPDADDPDAVAKRLEQLRRGLAPEDEFSLLVTWLGRCRLIHKLGQEQLPVHSVETYRVPDFLAVFEHDGSLIPVLVEVKSTHVPDNESMVTATVSLKAGYRRYAELLDLPMLVAWRCENMWTLFDMRHATLAETNYRIAFRDAMRQNLLGILTGDFAYQVAAGTAAVLRITKLSETNPETGGFDGRIDDAHYVSRTGERLPDIPHLLWLFTAWENEQRQEVDEEGVTLKFVVPEGDGIEFASHTFGVLVRSFAGHDTEVNWRRLTHEREHFVHGAGRFRELIERCLQHQVVTHVLDVRPADPPDFLP
jgi:hypothetical protein